MRYLVLISLLFIYSSVSAQSEKSAGIAADGFTNALVDRDTVELKKLLDDKLIYGHSNGWKQSKRELIEDLYNGKIIYKNISSTDQQITLEGSTACVRATSEIDVVMEGKPVHFKLMVLQVWIWKNKQWKLLSRQSTRIN